MGEQSNIYNESLYATFVLDHQFTSAIKSNDNYYIMSCLDSGLGVNWQLTACS